MISRYTERSTGTSAEDDDPGDGRGSQQHNWRIVRSSTVLMSSTCLLFLVLSHNKNLLEIIILMFAVKSIFSSDLIERSETNADHAGANADVPPVDTLFNFDSLPSEVKGRILEFLGYEKIIQLQSLSKSWKSLIESDEFIQALSLRKQPYLTACYFFIEKAVWQWAGFDPNWRENSSSTNSGKWRRLPPLTFLPADCDPDADLFKQFLVCAKDGLMCMNFSKSPHEERLIVFNPLTQYWKELPPLLNRRNPVLMHMLVPEEATHSYQILVAGSSGSSDEHLSKLTELYDSRTGRWESVDDVPGPAFALNEYQSGVHQNGTIFCIGFVELHEQMVKGILGFSIADRKWSRQWTERALPSSAILQLVENNGVLFLFSERENGYFIEHWVDRLERTPKEGDEETTTFKLVNVIKKQKIGGRSLEVYPEFALVPYSQWQLCIYNTVDHSGEVFDIQADQEKCEALPALPEKGFRGELGFYCLNPMSFAIELSFSSKV